MKRGQRFGIKVQMVIDGWLNKSQVNTLLYVCVAELLADTELFQHIFFSGIPFAGCVLHPYTDWLGCASRLIGP